MIQAVDRENKRLLYCYHISKEKLEGKCVAFVVVCHHTRRIGNYVGIFVVVCYHTKNRYLCGNICSWLLSQTRSKHVCKAFSWIISLNNVEDPSISLFNFFQYLHVNNAVYHAIFDSGNIMKKKICKNPFQAIIRRFYRISKEAS